MERKIFCFFLSPKKTPPAVHLEEQRIYRDLALNVNVTDLRALRSISGSKRKTVDTNSSK